MSICISQSLNYNCSLLKVGNEATCVNADILSFASLTEVDETVAEESQHIVSLYLMSQSMYYLPNDVFRFFPKISEIRISTVLPQIMSISQGQFQGLSNLRNVYIVGQRIRNIGANVFDGAKGVTNLFLPSNQIESIHKQAFAGLNDCIYLSLSSNRITSLDGEMFTHMTNLWSMNLENNQIATVQPELFENNKLTILDLSHNKLQSIPKNILNNFLESNDNQKILSMKGNKCNDGIYTRKSKNVSDSLANCFIQNSTVFENGKTFKTESTPQPKKSPTIKSLLHPVSFFNFQNLEETLNKLKTRRSSKTILLDENNDDLKSDAEKIENLKQIIEDLNEKQLQNNCSGEDLSTTNENTEGGKNRNLMEDNINFKENNSQSSNTLQSDRDKRIIAISNKYRKGKSELLEQIQQLKRENMNLRQNNLSKKFGTDEIAEESVKKLQKDSDENKSSEVTSLRSKLAETEKRNKLLKAENKKLRKEFAEFQRKSSQCISETPSSPNKTKGNIVENEKAEDASAQKFKKQDDEKCNKLEKAFINQQEIIKNFLPEIKSWQKRNKNLESTLTKFSNQSNSADHCMEAAQPILTKKSSEDCFKIEHDVLNLMKGIKELKRKNIKLEKYVDYFIKFHNEKTLRHESFTEQKLVFLSNETPKNKTETKAETAVADDDEKETCNPEECKVWENELRNLRETTKDLKFQAKMCLNETSGANPFETQEYKEMLEERTRQKEECDRKVDELTKGASLVSKSARKIDKEKRRKDEQNYKLKEDIADCNTLRGIEEIDTVWSKSDNSISMIDDDIQSTVKELRRTTAQFTRRSNFLDIRKLVEEKYKSAKRGLSISKRKTEDEISKIIYLLNKKYKELSEGDKRIDDLLNDVNGLIKHQSRRAAVPVRSNKEMNDMINESVENLNAVINAQNNMVNDKKDLLGNLIREAISKETSKTMNLMKTPSNKKSQKLKIFGENTKVKNFGAGSSKLNKQRENVKIIRKPKGDNIIGEKINSERIKNIKENRKPGNQNQKTGKNKISKANKKTEAIKKPVLTTVDDEIPELNEARKSKIKTEKNKISKPNQKKKTTNRPKRNKTTEVNKQTGGNKQSKLVIKPDGKIAATSNKTKIRIEKLVKGDIPRKKIEQIKKPGSSKKIGGIKVNKQNKHKKGLEKLKVQNSKERIIEIRKHQGSKKTNKIKSANSKVNPNKIKSKSNKENKVKKNVKYHKNIRRRAANGSDQTLADYMLKLNETVNRKDEVMRKKYETMNAKVSDMKAARKTAADAEVEFEKLNKTVPAIPKIRKIDDLYDFIDDTNHSCNEKIKEETHKEFNDQLERIARLGKEIEDKDETINKMKKDKQELLKRCDSCRSVWSRLTGTVKKWFHKKSSCEF